MATVPARDGFVVDSEPLSAMLRTFANTWNQERPPPCRGNRRQAVSVEPISAADYLAQESGVKLSTVKHLLHDPPQHPTAKLETADALVAALGQPQAFHDGTLTVLRRERGTLVPADRLNGSGDQR